MQRSHFQRSKDDAGARSSRRGGSRRGARPRRAKALAVTKIGERHAAYLTILVVGLTLFGLVNILSATSVSDEFNFDDPLTSLKEQAVMAAAGAVLFVIASRIDYRIMRKAASPLLITAFVMLVAVLIPGVGVARNGASRWLSLGPIQIQPAEITKFALILFVAHLLALRERRMDKADLTVRPVMILLVITSILLALQPKLTTIAILGFTLFVMLYVAGSKMRHLFPWIMAGFSAFVVAVIASSYARERVMSFFGSADAAGWQQDQSDQSLIGIGSGKIFGSGIGAGKAKHTPVPFIESDFIFTNLAEETGFIGAAAIICAFLLIIWFGLRASLGAPDRFGMLLALGITCWIATQAFLNIAVVLAIIPTTGVTLPLMSKGGSSLVMTLAALGLLVNIARRAKG